MILMNNKGQALVEFVLILPIFIFIIFIIYDFGKIYNYKNSLENKSNDIITLFKSGKTEESIKSLYQDIEISFTNDDEYYKITCKDEIDIITPGLGKVLGNPYIISVERYLPNE